MEKTKKVGLALGGGAVLGAAHIGVLRAIEEFDIEVQYLSGTSIGALVAALFAFGKTWQEIQEQALTLKWLDISSISLTRYGLLSNRNLGELIIDQIGDKKIEDSTIPLAMIATDISNGTKVVLDKGSVADAVMASTCIPGLFIPVKQGKTLLVDGGIVENVPINTIRKMGAEYIIGVDLNAKNSYKKPKDIIDVMLNSFHFLMNQSTKYQTQNAELLIEPDLSSFNSSNPKQVKALIEKGYEEAMKTLEKYS
ncbi:MAG: patatin-like phospholipase family protein [Salinivirgaceae bacterium]|nr:patatin-like phospholipase family protein [Salinivirgaceae bacterium]